MYKILAQVSYLYMICNGTFNLYWATLFCTDNVVCFLSLLLYSCALHATVFMEANNMSLGQTAHIRLLPYEQSDLGPYCLQTI